MTDVVILGGGPAGLSASITLKEHGYSVIIIERSTQPVKSSGESLASSARHSLARLGLWDVFLEDDHQENYANRSAWGSSQLNVHSFIQSEDGYAWHIDRGVFGRRLKERALALGVTVIISPRQLIQQNSDHTWTITSDHLKQDLTAKVIVDATGRSSWVARKLGVTKLKNDDQVALITFLKSNDHSLLVPNNLIESVEDGWWYTAPQKDGRLACIYFTDPDLHEARSLIDLRNWNRVLGQTEYTKTLIAKHGFRVDSTPLFKSANTTLLSTAAGDGWIAIGDAAMSYDPLSSHGLSVALASAIDAADAIDGYLKNYPLVFDHYAAKLKSAYIEYSTLRFKNYMQEQRWLDAPFWKRRHSLDAHFAFVEKCLDTTH